MTTIDEMSSNTRRRRVLAATVTTFAFALVGGPIFGASCASPVESVIVLGYADGSGGNFGTADGEASDASTPPARVLACIGTECPEGLSTCSDGKGPALKCGTDLKHDVNHCGACGNKCRHYPHIHMTSRCVDGSCELECWNIPPSGTFFEWRNCNQKVDDGCETDVYRDEKNCGACGNACPAGEPCIEGKCGCPSGKKLCDGRCVDTQNDDQHCGDCNIACGEADGPCSLPDTAYYGCGGGTCGAAKCRDSRGDCNEDLNDPQCRTDGCEVADLTTDPNNCGGCGIRCKTDEGEKCLKGLNGAYCGFVCKQGMTLCPFDGCRDLLNDPKACGACSNACPEPKDHQTRACRKGVCELDCEPGYGDCNGDPTDGCETNLLAHPGNCGACGNACDLAAGQPCVHGQCLMIECDGGVVN